MAAVSVRSLCGDSRDNGSAAPKREKPLRTGMDEEDRAQAWATRGRCASARASPKSCMSLTVNDISSPAKNDVRLPSQAPHPIRQIPEPSLSLVLPRSCASHFGNRSWNGGRGMRRVSHWVFRCIEKLIRATGPIANNSIIKTIPAGCGACR